MEIGLLGAIIIVLAWAYETYLAYKNKEKLNIRFTAIYIAGLILLTFYSYQIGDLPFLMLNGIILVLHMIELDFALRRRTKRKPSAAR